MTFESVVAVIQQYQPSLFFFMGMLGSFLICVSLTLVDLRFRQRQYASLQIAPSHHTYRQFRQDLTKSTRHVGFSITEIHELNDNDFQSC